MDWLTSVFGFVSALMGGGNSSDQVGKAVFANGFNQSSSGRDWANLNNTSVISQPLGTGPNLAAIADPDLSGGVAQFAAEGWKEYWNSDSSLTQSINAFNQPGGFFGAGSDDVTGLEWANLGVGVVSDLWDQYNVGRSRDLARQGLAQQKEIAGWGPFGTNRGDKPGEGAPYNVVEAFDAKGIQAPLATTALGGRNPAFPKGGLLSKKV